MSEPIQIETINDHMVGMQASNVVVLRPPLRPMPFEEALRMAAWIVALVDEDEAFAAILAAVRST